MPSMVLTTENRLGGPVQVTAESLEQVPKSSSARRQAVAVILLWDKDRDTESPNNRRFIFARSFVYFRRKQFFCARDFHWWHAQHLL